MSHLVIALRILPDQGVLHDAVVATGKNPGLPAVMDIHFAHRVVRPNDVDPIPAAVGAVEVGISDFKTGSLDVVSAQLQKPAPSLI